MPIITTSTQTGLCVKVLSKTQMYQAVGEVVVVVVVRAVVRSEL
jgi:site-specific DNA-cytosine methylase